MTAVRRPGNVRERRRIEALVEGYSLTETEIAHNGKRFLVRSTPRPAANLAVRAAGVALPPTVQALAAD